MQALSDATVGNRLLGVIGAKLLHDVGIRKEDLAAACTHLMSVDLIAVDWTTGNTSAMVTGRRPAQEGLGPQGGRLGFRLIQPRSLPFRRDREARLGR